MPNAGGNPRERGYNGPDPATLRSALGQAHLWIGKYSQTPSQGVCSCLELLKLVSARIGRVVMRDTILILWGFLALSAVALEVVGALARRLAGGTGSQCGQQLVKATLHEIVAMG